MVVEVESGFAPDTVAAVVAVICERRRGCLR